MDSVFNMRRPYDLMSMLKQEERATTVEKLGKELVERKEEIDKNEEIDQGSILLKILQCLIFDFKI